MKIVLVLMVNIEMYLLFVYISFKDIYYVNNILYIEGDDMMMIIKYIICIYILFFL